MLNFLTVGKPIFKKAHLYCAEVKGVSLLRVTTSRKDEKELG
jgi:hypothetical protein